MDVIEPWREPGALFVDVFTGALNVVRHAKAPRIALDLCLPLITTLRATQAGWVPPESVSPELYASVKANPNPQDPLTAFVMFGRSYGGKWGGGYMPDFRQVNRKNDARNKVEKSGQWVAHSTVKKLLDCRDLELFHLDYRQIPDPPPGTIMYADPPYEGTTAYNGVPAFDPQEFWAHALWWHKCGALVFVSEGAGARPPADWLVFKEWDQQSALASDKTRRRTERLYVHRFSPMGLSIQGGPCV